MPLNGVVNGLVCPATERLDGSQYAPVPLTKVHVEARVVNFVSQVTVTQNYVNKEKNPLEAIYFFPVEEEAAVINFTAELEGRTVKTVVKEKVEAKQEYQEAVRDKRTAFLLEETKPDIFQIQVGHLSPGSGCTISITYLSELPVEDGKTRLTVPTTIAPRYIPGVDKSEASGKITSIQYDLKTPANMTFKLDSIMKTKIKGIESPSHSVVNKIETEADNNNFFVGETLFEGSTSDMDRDIVVLIETEEPNQPKIMLEKNEEGSTVGMLSLVPIFALKDITAEIIFLMDCSGSMSGKSINLAKEALQLFLHSLPMDCYFNIVCFGSSFQSLFSESKKYDDITLDAAKNLAANLKANMGGTEILRPLEHIFKQKTIPGNPRQVFVLTDGEVSDSSRCINCAKKNNDNSRVFTLGIGSSADRHLVKGMARAGQGTAVFATYGEKIAPKVLKQLKNSLQPCINNVKIGWGDGVEQNNAKWQKPGMETTKTLMGYGKPKTGGTGVSEERSAVNNQAPSNVPAVYDGSRLLVYKKLTDGKYPENVTVTAETPDGALDLVLPIDDNNILEGSLVHQMFARKLIQDLEEGGDDLEQCNDGKTDFIKSQIIDLGIKYSLASKFTSFVGVDEKEGKERRVMLTRQIKNQVAHGYGAPPQMMFGGGPPQMMFGGAPPQMMAMMRSSPQPMMRGHGGGLPAPPPPGAAPLQSLVKADCAIYRSGYGAPPQMMASSPQPMMSDCADSWEDDSSEDDCLVSSKDSRSGNGKKNGKDLSETDKLIELTSLQIANGSFKWGDIIEEVAEKSVADIETAASKNGVENDAWLTAVVVMIIETQFLTEKESWEMIVEKFIYLFIYFDSILPSVETVILAYTTKQKLEIDKLRVPYLRIPIINY